MRLTEDRLSHSGKGNNAGIHQNLLGTLFKKQAWMLYVAIALLISAFNCSIELNQSLLSGLALIALIIFLKTLSKKSSL
jgi:hypothetical protein